MAAQISRQPFATLIPRNECAVLAFSQLCEYLQCNTSEYTHHRQFMDIDPAQVTLGQALQESADPAYSTDATDALPENDRLETMVWMGRFVFDLTLPPELVHIGWRCGYGRWSSDSTGRLDIALGLPEESKKLRIHGNHLSFNFLVETGVFAIHANSLLWVDARHIDRSRNNGRYLLQKPQQTLEIGEARYEFKYIVNDESDFVANRGNYIRDVMQHSSSLICESPTPSKDDIHIGKWRLLGTVGRGSESIVVSAISSDNELVVVKTLDKIRLRSQYIDQEIRRYRSISESVADSKDSRYLLSFIESIQGDHTAYLFFSPHVRHDFRVLLRDPRTYSRRIHSQLFIQALRGVGALHAAGFMHRDLKPANIGIACLDPPHAVVLDMGLAVKAEGHSEPKSSPGTIGTIGYIAPEMEDVRIERYGVKVDIWAMACVGMQVLLPHKSGPGIRWDRVYYFLSSDGKGRNTYRFNPWRTFATFKQPCPTEMELDGQRYTYKKELKRLSHSEEPVQELLGEMLMERPHWRPDIFQVIERFEALHFEDWQGQSTTGGETPRCEEYDECYDRNAKKSKGD